MIVKLLIFAVLSGSVVQALLPIENLGPTSTEASCMRKISWYKDITEQTKRLYNEYYVNLAEASINPENLKTLNEEHRKFGNSLFEVFEGPNDDSEKKIDCQAKIDWYKRMNENLTEVAADIEKELLDVLNRSDVPSPQQKNITNLLNELTKFLSIAFFPINQFKDLNTLVKESQIDQEEKLLESVHKAEQGDYKINLNSSDQKVTALLASSHVNHHPVHHTSHSEIHHTDRHDDRHYTPRRTPRHHTIHPGQQKYVPGAAIAAGCIVLIVIIIAMVAVLCPCERSPYRQF